MKIEIQEVPTLCLNMIVKNESKIILRLLNSLVGFMDCFCICDTGSTDNTIQLIENFSRDKGVPGVVIRKPFKNFAFNRSFALKSCVGMSDYVLLLDADMIFEIGNFDKNKLKDADSFCLLQGNDNYYYKNMRIVRNNGLYKYTGVTHEYVEVPQNNRNINLKKDELFIRDIGDGGSKADKFERDIKLLLEGIKEDPNTVRYHFYLANSYKDSQQFEKAIEYYKKRISMGGWHQEIWYSYYNIGNIYQHEKKMADAIYYWMECYNNNPLRLESLYKIVNHYRDVGKHKTAKVYYDLAKNVLTNTNIEKDDYLFLENDVYTYKFDYEHSILACYLNIKNINDEVVSILNKCDNYGIVLNTLSNMKFYKDVLKHTNLIDLSFKKELKFGDLIFVCNSSSSSMLKKSNNDGYMLNIRMVNYFITDSGKYMNCDEHIMTNNKYVELDNNFSITSEKMFDLKYDKNKKYLGVEDIRIFTDDGENNDKLIYIGTSQQKSGKIGMFIGDYNVNTEILESSEVIPSFINSDCEKNWVYFKYAKYYNENYLIYGWSPLKICKINKEKNTLDLIETKNNVPRILNHSRGSTNGFTYNNEIWFVLHIVSYENPRHYYHIFAVFDLDVNFLRHSSPFKFEGECIEYCIGLIVEDERIITTYSTWDRTTKLAVYDKSYIDGLLKYTY